MSDREDLKRMRQDAASQALAFKEKVGPGLSEVLRTLRISDADVRAYHQRSGAAQGFDLRMSAKDMAFNRIGDNYPDWSELKINSYLDQATANDPEPETPAVRAAAADAREAEAVEFRDVPTSEIVEEPQRSSVPRHRTSTGFAPGLTPVDPEEARRRDEIAAKIERREELSADEEGDWTRLQLGPVEAPAVTEPPAAGPAPVSEPDAASPADSEPEWKRRVQRLRETFGLEG